MKTLSILFLILACYDLSHAGDEFVAVTASPVFAKIDGINCEGRSLRWDAAYVCYRARRSDDLKTGEYVYGIDEPVSKDGPRIVISRILFTHIKGSNAKEWYELPKELVHDLTEPNLGPQPASSSRSLSLLRQGQRITIYHAGSDAGGAYEVNWIIDLTAMKTSRIVISHAGPEDKLKGNWFPLQRIPQPDSL